MPSTHYKNTDNLKCNDHFSKFPFAAGMTMTEHVQLNANNDLRKLHTLPKLIFETVKVVVSHVIEFHTISRTCNRQLNRYTRPIFLTSTDAIWSRMTSPPLVYMIHRRTVRVPECTLYSHLRSFRCEDDLLVIYGLQNVIFSSFETQFKVVLLKTDPESTFPDLHSLNSL